jgi:hypothetical protein
MSDIEQNGGLTDNENTLSVAEHDMDAETMRIYGMYEEGQSVPFIAAQIGKSEAYVYAKMRQVPEKYEAVKRIRQESNNSRLRRIILLADMNNERFMEDMWDDSEMAAENIDKINRIGKEYARRIQLMEDKATERIGIGGKGGLPFKFVINKHYPSAPDADKDEENDTVEGDTANE